ncbi:MAG: hypothetical protein IJW86_07790 [Clostridia bacterium]|nr:hypothetical protein [Clostridia bacterium]
MDTKSTKFNGRLIVKIIAVILALTVVGFSAKGALDDFLYIANQEDIDVEYYLEGIFVKEDRDFFTSEVFDSCMRNYFYDLNRYLTVYGDGTKASFEKLNGENKTKFETYKHNLLTNIYREIVENEVYSESVFSLVSTGVIELKLHKEDKSKNYEEHYVHLFDTYYEWELYSNCDEESGEYNKTNFEANTKKAKALGGELLVDLPYVEIEKENQTVIFDPGTHILSIKEDIFKQGLIDCGLSVYFGTYEEYKNALREDNFRTAYKNIYYSVTLDDGTVITNDKKQTVPISGYNFTIVGSDGRYVSNRGSVYYDEGSRFYNGYQDFYVRIEHRPATNQVQNVKVTTTMPEVTHPTQETTYHASLRIDGSENAVGSYDLAVYFNKDAVFFGEKSIAEMQTELLNAGAFAREAIVNVALGLGIYLIALVILCILAGRRSPEDDTVYLLPTDKIFLEIKLLISAGLIALAFGAAILIIDEYPYISYSFAQFFINCLPVLASVVAGILMEFILSVTKIIKAKRFIKSLFIVWLFKKPVKFIFKMLKKFFSLLLMPGKALIKLYRDVKEKLYYTKNIKKIVLIKTGILVALNVICPPICILTLQWGLDHFGELVILVLAGVPLIFADVFTVLRALKFVGGVDRLLEVLSAYRKGNLDTYINRAAIPDYLIPATEDLEELGDGIRIAVEEAVKQETTKTELITNISHDLKTPLTSIINYVELLKHCDIQNETAQSYLEVLGEKSDRLKYLISDLVEASKAATGNIDVSLIDVSLKEMLSQIIGEHSDAFDKKGLSIVCDIPENDIIVRADSKLLYRVLENLIVNVKKYAMASTRVYISAERSENKGIITLKNISAAPLNISPEELKQRFVRGDASRTTEGNGLGLSIAENLCLLQGGRLDIDIVGDLFIAKVEMEAK